MNLTLTLFASVTCIKFFVFSDPKVGKNTLVCTQWACNIEIIQKILFHKPITPPKKKQQQHCTKIQITMDILAGILAALKQI